MILVLGGTSDSLKICEVLSTENIDFILSVTTDYGKEISIRYAKNLSVGKMNIDQMISFINKNKISAVIDCTHPYAQEVSKNAIKVSSKLNINYLRYERPSSDILEDDSIFKVSSIEEACDLANKIGNKIFLATGSKNLEYFAKNLNKEIVARVLPTYDVIKSCEEIGLNPENIIGMKGPFTHDINKSLYSFYNVDLVITKESGKEGGFIEKISAAKEININTIVIIRPKVEYPNVISSIEEVKEAVLNYWRGSYEGSGNRG